MYLSCWCFVCWCFVCYFSCLCMYIVMLYCYVTLLYFVYSYLCFYCVPILLLYVILLCILLYFAYSYLCCDVTFVFIVCGPQAYIFTNHTQQLPGGHKLLRPSLAAAPPSLMLNPSVVHLSPYQLSVSAILPARLTPSIQQSLFYSCSLYHILTLIHTFITSPQSHFLTQHTYSLACLSFYSTAYIAIIFFPSTYAFICLSISNCIVMIKTSLLDLCSLYL